MSASMVVPAPTVRLGPSVRDTGERRAPLVSPHQAHPNLISFPISRAISIKAAKEDMTEKAHGPMKLGD